MGFGQTVNKPVAPATETVSKGSGPVAKIKYGGITLDVWNNKGEHADYNTFTLQRSYKQGTEWKNTNSLRTQDLPKAILALQEAYKQALTSEQDDKE